MPMYGSKVQYFGATNARKMSHFADLLHVQQPHLEQHLFGQQVMEIVVDIDVTTSPGFWKKKIPWLKAEKLKKDTGLICSTFYCGIPIGRPVKKSNIKKCSCRSRYQIETASYHFFVIFNVFLLRCLQQRINHFPNNTLISCQIVMNENPRKRPRAPPNSATKEVKG